MKSRKRGTGPRSSGQDYPDDFLRHLEERLAIDRQQAQLLLSTWMKAFAPAKGTPAAAQPTRRLA